MIHNKNGQICIVYCIYIYMTCMNICYMSIYDSFIPKIPSFQILSHPFKNFTNLEVMLPRRDVPLPWGGQLLRSLESPEAKHLEAMAKEQVPKCRTDLGEIVRCGDLGWLVGWLVGWSIWVSWLVGFWFGVMCLKKIKRAS